ncbi:MAG: asparagine synthase [Thaumarchaeota archaeon]|nr:asparagine synthase [Nitrososphaerota archaeon]MDE1817763.1 asparagine synthase [Nitrososphaerota archaeon]MDE1875347.1 asparagine synthase [Nitrososphaerota archaeon]
MEEILQKINTLVTKSVQNHKCDSIALSGGLDSSILASCVNKETRAFAMVAKDFPSTDLVHAQLVAKLYGLKLDVITADVNSLLLAAEDTIKILEVFNPIEIRNNIVVYLTMKTAKEHGFQSIMTGDGADELFAGYNFFKKMSPMELEKDLERIWSVMHFPSKAISKSIGITLHTPFLDDAVSEYVKKIAPDLKVHEENGKKYGKWILRKAFENDLPKSIAWRDKSAMQDGSGTSGLTSFLDGVITDSVFAAKSRHCAEKEKVTLSSKESLYYYEIYRKYFDMPHTLGKSDFKCPNCNYSLKPGSHFCRMCGSFPI